MTDIQAEKERIIAQYRSMLEQYMNRLDVLDGQFDGQIERDKALNTLRMQDPHSVLRAVLERSGVPDVIFKPGTPVIEQAARALFGRLDRNQNDIIEDDEAKHLHSEIINGLIALTQSAQS